MTQDQWNRLVSFIIKMHIALASGVIGGISNALVLLLLYVTRINKLVNSTFSPLPYTPCWLYNKLVWGAIWSALLLIPLKKPHYMLRGVLFGLIVSYTHLLIVFPAQGDGVMGHEYGWCTFLLVNLSDITYGVVSISWFTYVIQRLLPDFVRNHKDEYLNESLLDNQIHQIQRD